MSTGRAAGSQDDDPGGGGALPLESLDDVPADLGGGDGDPGEAAPWADGPGHGASEELPPPDEVPPSPS